MDGTRLNETSPELIAALSGIEGVRHAYSQNTGGHVMVATMDIAEGRELWLTRDGDGDSWLLGFYNFGKDPEDEGALVHLALLGNEDDPQAVARCVEGILARTVAVTGTAPEARTVLCHLNVEVPADSSSTAEDVQREVEGALEVGISEHTPTLVASQVEVVLCEEV